MAKATYYDQLKDPRWQKKRLEILERDDFTCRHCGSTDKTLHVHHSFYRKGAAPWEYHESTLKALCGECHEWAEGRRETMLWLFGMLSDESQASITGFAAARVGNEFPQNQTPHIAHFCDPCDDRFMDFCRGLVVGEMFDYCGPSEEQAAAVAARAVMDTGSIHAATNAAFSTVTGSVGN